MPRTIGIIGALLLIVGVLLPIGVSPEHGATTLLTNPISIASGVIVIVVSLASIVFALVGKEPKMLTTALIAVFIVTTSFLSFSGQLAKAQSDPSSAAATINIQLGIGWLVLGLGALTLLAAAFLARYQAKRDN